ncbi:MAG TPA: hypothetical protein DEO84_11575 [candidate division Zixibacteria bacterium]|nr:hypothetical protein [candidate division Zixibacteria bacterium]HBZ01947.1 hypothetical protein [candidate division Zixibacteria bacterium]
MTISCHSRKICVSVFIIVAVILPSSINAGPPFVTDDPEPVDYRHWEFYLASQVGHESDGWSGTCPHIELNYGAIPNLQLHLIAPINFSAPKHGTTQFGYGDTEIGVKYRFMDETAHHPQMGLFPIIEIPTGDRGRDLGGGQFQMFLPLWIQKSIGAEGREWTSYGGAGYWINPGSGNRDWWLIGWLLQRRLNSILTMGIELFHTTPDTIEGESGTKLNMGAILDLSDSYHFLFSAGNSVQGSSGFESYVALQTTLGPRR